MHGPRASSGFTLVELITIMILVGILAVVAFPRMDGIDVFRSVEFRDRTIAALRHAHKTAIAQRRMVCAVFGANSVTLTIDRNSGGECDAALVIPGSPGNVVVGNGVKAVFSAVPPALVPAVLFFQPDGRVTRNVAGTALAEVAVEVDGLPIRVVGITGFIGDAL